MTRQLSRASLLACICIAFVSFLSAQNPSFLTGVVTDPDSRPIPRALVLLEAGDGTELDRTLTDNRGQFRLSAPGDGPLRVRVELPGFEPFEGTVARGETIEIQLALAPVREEVVVTPTRSEAPGPQVGTNFWVLTGEEIEARPVVQAADALRTLTGGAIVRSGGYGTITSLFVRGGENDYNKVLLDGVPLNEPGGTFFLDSLTLDNIDRVEVVRGPQSALFGSDAVSSVLQLFTRRGSPETAQPRFTLALEGGNESTFRGLGGLSGGAGRLDYAATWSRFQSDNRVPENSHHRTSVSSNLGFTLNEQTAVRAIVRGSFARTGLPNQFAFGPPDTGEFSRRGEGVASLALRNRWSPAFQQQVLYGFSQVRARTRDTIVDAPFTPTFEGATASFDRFDFASDFLSNNRRHHLSYQADWFGGAVAHPAGQHQLTFALDWEGERGFLGAGVNPRRDNFGWVFQHQALWSRFSLTTGARIENNDSFGTAVAPRVSAAWYTRTSGGRIGATKLKFNFGLGVKEPTLFESFSPSPFALGNPDLQEERTRSFDFGVEQRFGYGHLRLELNVFHNRFRNLIGFEITDFTTFEGSFFNIGRAKAKGVETILDWVPGRGLHARGSYTLLDSQVTQTGTVFDPVLQAGSPLLRRPRHSGAVEVWWEWKQLAVNSTTLIVGKRADSDFAGLGLETNDGYTRWDVSTQWRTVRNVTYFLAMENLLDRDYMEVLGFPALRRMVRAGARVEF